MLLSDFIQARREKRIEAAKVEGIEGKAEGRAEGIAKGIAEAELREKRGLIASVQSGIVAERKQRHEARRSQNRPQHNHRRNQKNNLITDGSSIQTGDPLFYGNSKNLILLLLNKSLNIWDQSVLFIKRNLT